MAKRNPLKSIFSNIKLIPPITAAVFLFAASAAAKTIDLSWAAQKRSTIVSGTLNPSSLSINGQEITLSSESHTGLVINGEAAKVNDVSGLKTFYEVVEGDRITLQWSLENGSTKDILTVAYPSVKDMLYRDNTLVLRLNDLTRKVRYDGQELELKDPVTIPIEDTEKWLSEPHTLELSADKNVSQIYNLDFNSIRKQMLNHRSWVLYSGEPPFSANVRPQMIGAGARLLNENNFSKELVVAGAKTTYGMGSAPFTNEATQQAILIEFRYGYNPFKTNFGTVDYKRVSFGLQAALVNYTRESTFPAFMDGYNDTKVNTWFNQGGFFLRWEPVQYKDFGVLIHLNHRVFKSQSTIGSDSTSHAFGLAYYF